MSDRGGPAAAAPERFPVVLTLIVLVMLAILVSLGVWQLQRLKWKENLLHQIAALESAPAQPLSSVLAREKAGADVSFTRVSTPCPDVETRPVLRLFTVAEGGVAGYRLITACPLAPGEGYGSILVDRGFVAQLGDELPRDLPGQPIAAPVVGVLRGGGERSFVTPKNRPGQNQWYWRDVAAMAQALHAPDPAPLYLMLESPAPASGQPRPSPLPPNIPNNHLGYAITWFGLAGALVGVYLAMLFRKRQT
jgi:surfeit locus 1 family protein